MSERKPMKAVVLQVIESDGRGPRVFRRLHEDEEVNVVDNLALWVVYANASVVDAPKPN
jgi:hypothetical protein